MTLLNPKWYTSNFIKSASELSSGTTKNKQKLFDRNEENRYFTIGVTTNPRQIRWLPTEKFTINRFFIQNCNWEDFQIVKLPNGTAPADPIPPLTTGSILNFSNQKNLYFEVDPIEIDGTVGDVLLFEVNEIFGGVLGEAIAGQIYVGSELFGLPADRIGSTGLTIAPQVSQQLFNLSDGTTQKIFVRKTVNYNLPLSNVSEDDRVDFEDLYERNRRDTFVFVPRPVIFGSGKWDGLGNHYNWANANDFLSFTANNFANGFDVNMVMLQAGGLD